MLTAIKIKNNISCEYLCKQIEFAIKKYEKNNSIIDCLLIIDIKPTIENDSFIPKIEFKNQDA